MYRPSVRNPILLQSNVFFPGEADNKKLVAVRSVTVGAQGLLSPWELLPAVLQARDRLLAKVRIAASTCFGVEEQPSLWRAAAVGRSVQDLAWFPRTDKGRGEGARAGVVVRLEFLARHEIPQLALTATSCRLAPLTHCPFRLPMFQARHLQ